MTGKKLPRRGKLPQAATWRTSRIALRLALMLEGVECGLR
jgi:hypothetical protein